MGLEPDRRTSNQYVVDKIIDRLKYKKKICCDCKREIPPIKDNSIRCPPCRLKWFPEEMQDKKLIQELEDKFYPQGYS